MDEKIILKTYEPKVKFLERYRNKLKISCLILLFLIVIFLSSYVSINFYEYKEIREKSIVRFVGFSSQEITGEIPNYDLFLKKIKEEKILDLIPENGMILLKFYNFNSGKRKWEESFVLKKGEAIKGETKDYDLLVIIHSKYVNDISLKSLCEVIPDAKLNNDLGIETNLSEVELLLKYNSFLEYRSCLGL
jgi:hypothetical protein